jgi:hypothetical protein
LRVHRLTDRRKGESLRSVARLLLLGLVLASGCAGPPPGDEPAADRSLLPTADRPLDSVALIDNAVGAGRLDYSTGLLYKIYVMFEPASLPQEYQSEVPAKCGTPLIQEVQRSWNLLTTEQRTEISQYVQPVGETDKTNTQLDDVSPDRMDGERDKLD